MSRGAGHHDQRSAVPATLKRALLRVRAADGRTVGLAFLLSDSVAVTCAHVVSQALGTGRSTPPGPDAEVTVQPVFAGDASDVRPGAETGRTLRAAVRHWAPPVGEGTPGAGADVAVLNLAAPHGTGHPLPVAQAASDLVGHHVRAFGLPASHPAGVWHEGRLAGQVASGWIQVNKDGPAGYRVSQGFSGSPVWDEALGQVVGMVTVADVGAVPAAFAVPIDQVLDSVPGLRDEVLPPSPFPGLRPFTGEHGYALLGRDQEITELVDRTVGQRHVGIVGSSGSGKSSLLRAGVAPRLRERGDVVVVLRPSDGGTPFDALAEAFAPLVGEPHERLAAGIEQDGLGHVAERAGPKDPGGRLVVIVDQLEEVFDRSPAQRDALADALLGDGAPASVRVLAALRHDFLGKALAHPRFRRLFQATALSTLSPLDTDGLRTMMFRPDEAGRPSVSFDPDLADRILADAQAGAAPMPLLSHVLDQMWRRTPGHLTHSSYSAVGGIAGAFEEATATWLSSVPTGAETHMTRLFARLVTVSAATALPTRRPARIGDIPAVERPLVQGLITAGILSAEGGADDETVVELSHDALFVAWEPLRAFVEKDRAFLVWSDLLQHDADRWFVAREPGHHLPSRAELETASAWEETHGELLSPRQREFLAAGRARVRQRVRRRRLLVTLTVLTLVVVLALTNLVTVSRSASAEQQRLASSRALASASQSADAADPALAVLTGVAAYRTAPTQEARDQLLRLFLRYGDRARVLSGIPGGTSIVSTNHSDDGDVLVTDTWLEHAVLAVGVLTGPVRQRELPVSRVQSVQVSADGQRVVYIQSDGGMGWFEVRPDEADLIGPVHELEHWSARVEEPADAHRYNGWPHSVSPSLSRDGRVLAARVWDRFVWWDLETGKIAGDVPASYDTLWDLWVGPGNRELLVPLVVDDTTLAQDLVAIDLSDGSQRVVVRGASSFLLSGDRRTVIRCRMGEGVGSVTRFRIADGRQLEEPFVFSREKGGDCTAGIVDLAGERMGLGVLDERAVIDLTAGEVVAHYRDSIGSDGLDGARFIERPEGLFRVSGGDSSISYLAVPESGGSSAGVEDQVLAADGRSSVVLTEPDGEDRATLQRNDADGTAVERRRLEPGWHPLGHDRLRLSPDGELVASREGRAVVALRDTRTLELVTKIVTRRPVRREESLPVEQFAGLLPQSGNDVASSDSWLTIAFDAAGNLVTVSDGVVQYWDVTTGHEIASVDAGALRGVGRDVPLAVAPYREPGKVAVTVPGEPGTSVVDLRTGVVVEEIPTRSDVLGVQFDPTGQYVATYRLGGTLEVWDLTSRAKVLGPVPGVGYTPDDLDSTSPFVVTFLDDGRFLVGDDTGIRIYEVGERGYPETYRFAGPQDGVLSVAAGGPTVAIRPADEFGTTQVLRLDPESWVRTLCGTVGYRAFTAAELAALPSDVAVPADVCATEAG